MKRKSASHFAFFNRDISTRLFVVLTGAFLLLPGVGTSSSAFAQAKRTKPAPIAAQGQEPKADSQAIPKNSWTSTGGPQGGDGLALVTNAGGYVFVGTLGGGAFRSADNGATWTTVNSG